MDFSKTERIVLLIDLQPLLTLQKGNLNPNYFTTILAAVKRLLTFPPLSAASLFTFKIFFSSLSPLRSSSTVHGLFPSPTSLSFNQASQTLSSLCETLNSLSLNSPILPELSNSLPSASHIASALLQLVHDYAWESESEICNINDFASVRSNLVVLFSPICKSLSCLFEHLDLGLNYQCLDQLLEKFHGLFGIVNEAFVSRDIHFSWINVDDENEEEDNECLLRLGLCEKVVRSLNWGFCSSNAIVLGSTLVPFGLIYPKIGVQLNFLNFDNLPFAKRRSQLCLEISDVNGKPLECKCCDLELLNLRAVPSIKSDDILNAVESIDLQGEGFGQGNVFASCFGDGMMKLDVRALWRNNEGKKLEDRISNYILVREFPGECKKSKNQCTEEFFACKVIEILSNELGGVGQVNSIPIWQMFLSFLHKEGCWAVVSLSNEIGNTAVGILKPFTAHWAVLSIMNGGCVEVSDCRDSNLATKATKIPDRCCNTLDTESFPGSQTETSTSGSCEPSLGDGRKRKSKKHQTLDLTWSTFCKAAAECSHFDLAEVFFAKQLNKSKKLKFLKCWMKQISKCRKGNLSALLAPKSKQEQLMCPSSEQCQMPEGVVSFTCSESETSESFFNNLPKRIEHGLQSKMDLQTLAERVVKSSGYWLSQLFKADQNSTTDDSSSKTVFTKLKKVLLKESKEMKEMREQYDSSSKAPESTSISDNIVREYELQIFLRMEILLSDVSKSIEEPAKQKLLKQICSYLEIIQYLVEGGIHGQIKLYDYVERNIKSRYSHILEDVVHEIYTQMDLLPFGDEDEVPSLLLNSEDSNKSWRERQDKYGKGETNSIQQSFSAEDDSYQAHENVVEHTKETTADECARKLNEARERRERARRFVSFPRRAPDLQRIWAPKQPKTMKGKFEPLQKELKRKKGRRGNESVVCETPSSEWKCPNSQESREEEEEHRRGNSYSVSKALFQDS